MCKILVIDTDKQFLEKVRNAVPEFEVLECSSVTLAEPIFPTHRPENLMIGFQNSNSLGTCAIQAITESDALKDPSHVFATI